MFGYRVRERQVVNDDKAVLLSPGQWEVFLMLWETEEPLSVEELAEKLYPDRIPEEAEGAVRSILLRLREKLREIDAEDSLVSLRAHGYIVNHR